MIIRTNLYVVHKITVAHVKIEISSDHDPSLFVTVVSDYLLPYNKNTYIPVSHLPCRYIRVSFIEGEMSIQNLNVIGSSKSEIYDIYGEDSEQIIFEKPQNILFN